MTPKKLPDGPDRTTVGRRIYLARLTLSARKGKPISQGEFARLVGAHLNVPLGQSSVSRWEADMVEPSFAEILAVAAVTGESAAELAFGEAHVNELRSDAARTSKAHGSR